MAMCRSVPALACVRSPGPVRASVGTVLGFAEDAVGRGTTVLGSGTLASGQQRVKINTRYHFEVSEARYSERARAAIRYRGLHLILYQMFGSLGSGNVIGARVDAGGHNVFGRRREIGVSRPRIAVACRQATKRRNLRQVMSWVESEDAAVPKVFVRQCIARISELTAAGILCML
jgi:hypothetical protein